MEQTYRNMIKLIFAAIIPVFSLSCETIGDDMDDCGIYLEFIYDYNMEYADSFDPQVRSVDVLVFDGQGRYLFTRRSAREELVGGKRMFFGDLTPGGYKILTIGGLSDDFRVSDGNDGALVPGETSLENVHIALVRQDAVVSSEFPDLWVAETIDIDNTSDLSVYPVHLVKDTNRFNLVLTEHDSGGSDRMSGPAYTFAIVTPEGAVYGPDNAPLVREKVTYTPYYLSPGDGTAELSVGRINTMRLLYDQDYAYRLVINSTASGKQLWDYDLMTLLWHLKPDLRPDGTALPMQEYLDRRSEWHVILVYKENPGGPEGFIAVGIKVNDWIVWLDEIGV